MADMWLAYARQRCALLLLCAVTLAVSEELVVNVSTGQQLAEAVAAFGRLDNTDMTVQLQNTYITVENVTFTRFDQLANRTHVPFSSGYLTVQAEPGSVSNRMPVLDTASRAGLTSGFSGTAKLILKNFVMVNMCELVLAFNTSGVSVEYVTALSTALFMRSRVSSSHYFYNMTFYARQADIGVYIYIRVLQSTPFQELTRLALPIIGPFPGAQAKVALRSQFGIVASSFNAATASGLNVTFTSLDNPLDPILQSMRVRGALRPPMFCNGTRVPDSLAQSMVDPNGPVYVVEDTLTFVRAMVLALESLTLPSPTVGWRAPPIVFIAGVIHLAEVPQLPEFVPVAGSMLLSGPNAEDVSPRYPLNYLDFGYRKNLFPVQPGFRLYAQFVNLAGLLRQPLPGAASASSALPLAALPLAGSVPYDPSFLHISLASCTLILGADDFLGLLVLALRGTPWDVRTCAGSAALAQAEALSPGLSVVKAQPLVLTQGNPLTNITLQTLQGWGINATDLTLSPEEPAAIYTLMTSCASVFGMAFPRASDSDTSSDSHRRMGGVIAGSVVGGAVLGAVVGAAGAWLLLARGHRRYAAEAGGPKGSSRESVVLNILAGTRHHEEEEETEDPSKASKGQRCRSQDESQCTPDSLDSAPHPPRPPSQGVARQSWPAMRAAHWPTLAQAVDEAERALGMVPGATPAPSQGNSGYTMAASVRTRQQLGPSEAGAPGGSVATSGGAQYSRQRSAPSRISRQLPAVADAGGVPDSHPSQPSDAQGSAGAGSEDQPSQRSSAGRHLQRSTSHPSHQVEHLVGQMRTEPENKVVVFGVVGKGAWGLVFRGEWRGLPVAVKTVVFSDGASQEYTGAVMEAAVATSLGHRNVVCTYQWDIQPLTELDSTDRRQSRSGLQIQLAFDGAEPVSTSCPNHAALVSGLRQYKLFLVQELCALSLTQALQQGLLHNARNGQVEEELLYELLKDISSGLEYMHQRNVIHGDLKPGNVLLKADMSPGCRMHVVAKLTDFGLSARLNAEATHVSNITAGTPYYVAPEVIHEYRSSKASDLWSLGVLMWQMYTGRTPYLMDSTGTYTANPVFPKVDCPKNPPAQYMDLMTRCLHRDPHERPTVQEALAVFQSLTTRPHGHHPKHRR